MFLVAEYGDTENKMLLAPGTHLVSPTNHVAIFVYVPKPSTSDAEVYCLSMDPASPGVFKSTKLADVAVCSKTKWLDPGMPVNEFLAQNIKRNKDQWLRFLRKEHADMELEPLAAKVIANKKRANVKTVAFVAEPAKTPSKRSRRATSSSRNAPKSNLTTTHAHSAHTTGTHTFYIQVAPTQRIRAMTTPKI
jgi:hypothetical protein